MSTPSPLDLRMVARTPGPDLSQLEGIDWQRLEQETRVNKCKSCGLESVSVVKDAILHEPCVRQSRFFRPNDLMPFACDQCPAVFWRTDQLEAHLLLHQGLDQQDFRCNHCGHRTGLKSQMFAHLMDRHYSHSCPVRECTVPKFHDRVEWEHHVERDHGLKLMECRDCAQIMTKDLGNYVRHRKSCPMLQAKNQKQTEGQEVDDC